MYEIKVGGAVAEYKKEALPHGGGPSQNISTLNSIRGFNPSIRVKSRA